MQIVIEPSDFQRLSPTTQRELLSLFSARFAFPGTAEQANRLRWRQPYDLSEEQAEKLLQGLGQEQRRRLALFAGKTGRVRMRDIMQGETNLRAASDFQKEMTRRLRRLIEDPEKKAQLIQWDFDSTRWDEGRTTIVDGVYYVSPATAHALRRALGRNRGERAGPES